MRWRRHVAQRDAVDAFQKRREPCRDAAEREGIRGEAGAGQHVRAIAREHAIGLKREGELRKRHGRVVDRERASPSEQDRGDWDRLR